MGSDIPAAPRQIHLDLKQSAVDTKKQSDLFAGVPYNFTEWAEKLPHSASKLKGEFKYLQRNLDAVITAYPNDKRVFQHPKQRSPMFVQLLRKSKKLS